MASNNGFFEECWTPLYPNTETGDPMERVDFAANPAAYNRHPLSQRFHDLLTEIGELHDRKQADYGRDADPFYNVRQTEQWGIPAWQGALIRLDDKIGRLRNLAVTQTTLRNESAEDSMLDIAVYALMALVLYEDATIYQPESARSGH